MASIEIIVRDNQGNIINEEKKRIYDLNIGNKKFSEVRFNDIERAVGEFKRISLPLDFGHLLNIKKLCTRHRKYEFKLYQEVTDFGEASIG